MWWRGEGGRGGDHPQHNVQLEATHRTSFYLEIVTHKYLVSLMVTHRKSLWVLPTESCFCFKVTHRKISKLHSHPQKDVFVLMLPTEKRFVFKLPTENRDWLSLPSKGGFFEKVPTEQRERLGATHMWNKALILRSLLIVATPYRYLYLCLYLNLNLQMFICTLYVDLYSLRVPLHI